MASGKWHDRSIIISSPLSGGIAYFLTKDWVISSIFTTSYFLGGMYLSPDLDLRSNVFYRWGFLRWIWKPYQRLIPHRGRFVYRNPLSHAPIIGTILRIGYLAMLCLPLVILSRLDSSRMVGWIMNNQNIVFTVLIGVESSSWIHLVMDISSTYQKLWIGK
ncbi:metal-binding protein [Nostoc linckia]|uniref:metal-binding protein n=1 Tax=Nostoc linckia TaxID=92942 RepID=UPI000BFFD7AF|nr:metal-binding protein [Nostoc linckia]